jgi:hypothetical protein
LTPDSTFTTVPSRRVTSWVNRCGPKLYVQSLCPVEPVAAPAAGPGEDGDIDLHCFPHRLPHHLDAELRGLTAMRDGWDELVGHLGLLVSMLGLWRTMGFASFAHYCAERPGMSARTVEQRVWLERRLYALPPLRGALREGRVGYEKARLVAPGGELASRVSD